MYAATVTHRRLLWPVKFALEGTVRSEVGILGLPHIPHKWKSQGVMSGDLGGQGIGPARPVTSIIVPFALETPFAFDRDRSDTRG
jgi:hypothetical protein